MYLEINITFARLGDIKKPVAFTTGLRTSTNYAHNSVDNMTTHNNVLIIFSSGFLCKTKERKIMSRIFVPNCNTDVIYLRKYHPKAFLILTYIYDNCKTLEEIFPTPNGDLLKTYCLYMRFFFSNDIGIETDEEFIEGIRLLDKHYFLTIEKEYLEIFEIRLNDWVEVEVKNV